MPPFAGNWAFFLDVDGTLLEHSAHPQAVRVGREHVDLLAGLAHAAHGALALISGRSVPDLDALFAPLRLPAAGQHGTELRLPDGALRRHAPPLELLGRAASEIVRLTAAHAGLVLENKGLSLALHYRQRPQLRELVKAEMRRIADALGDEFELQAGKFVFELKPSGKDKGTAIAEFMREPPFAGRTALFIGDDLTDEYGFALVERLAGHTVKVGPGGSKARWRLADAAAVRRWLRAYVECFTDEGARAGR